MLATKITPIEITNPYKFSAYRSTNVATTDFNGYTIIFNTELFDTNNNYDNTTGEYTVPVTGYYQINVNARIEGSIGTAWLWDAYIDLYIDNVTTESSRIYVYDQGQLTYANLKISNLFYLTAGQKVKIDAFGDTNSGGDWTLTGGRNNSSFSGYLVSV